MGDFERTRVFRDAVLLASIFVALLGAGTALFVAAGGDSLEIAFYRSVGSVTTNDFVGQSPSGSAERAVAAGLTVAGGLFYLALVGSVVRTLVVRTVAETWRERRTRSRLSSLRKHYVVCGYGNIGRAVARSLLADDKCVVVIDRKPENIEEAQRDGALALLGDAHDVNLLKEAGIRHADALVASVGSDAVNLYIGLAARRCTTDANPTLFIAARASTEEAQRNMQAAGVFNRVSTPYTGAGRALADDVIEHRADPKSATSATA